jgi:hypothetical protein
LGRLRHRKLRARNQERCGKQRKKQHSNRFHDPPWNQQAATTAKFKNLRENRDPRGVEAGLKRLDAAQSPARKPENPATPGQNRKSTHYPQALKPIQSYKSIAYFERFCCLGDLFQLNYGFGYKLHMFGYKTTLLSGLTTWNFAS